MPVVAGLDEAGRGALAGPVVAAAVILIPGDSTKYADSKTLTASRREELLQSLMESGASIGFGIVSHRHIDRINILQASLLAMRKALGRLDILPDEAWIDGKQIPKQLPCYAKAIVGGDGSVPCISAASIVAKVIRDHLMQRYDHRYSGYGFARHKGYGTLIHKRAIVAQGFSPIHRRTFSIQFDSRHT